MQTQKRFLTLGQLLFALPAVAFGLLHFVYPEIAGMACASGAVTTYATGLVLILAGVSVFLSRRLRSAVTLFGIIVLLSGLAVWVIQLMGHWGGMAGKACLRDAGIAGGALLLAGAWPHKDD